MKKWVVLFLAVAAVFLLNSFVLAAAPCTIKPVTCAVVQCDKFTFDATASYDPNNEKLSYLWDFGDGTTSTEPVVTHVYDKAGQYTVTLTVKDTSGLPCDTGVKTQVINVNKTPVPSFIGPESVCSGDTVTFDASATTDDNTENLTYAWDFGDGTTGEGKVVSKTYEKGGTYNVRLTANDNAGTPCSGARRSRSRPNP